jgi:hypothetical protein
LVLTPRELLVCYLHCAVPREFLKQAGVIPHQQTPAPQPSAPQRGRGPAPPRGGRGAGRALPMGGTALTTFFCPFPSRRARTPPNDSSPLLVAYFA